MRTVVTEGTGFIGNRVAEALLARGHDVLVLGSRDASEEHDVAVGATFLELDLDDASELKRVLDDFRPQFVCRQPRRAENATRSDEPRCQHDANVVAALALLEACVLCGVPTVVLADSAGQPVCDQLAVERYRGYCEREHGLRSIVLRYANVYGPGQEAQREPGVVATFIDRMLSNEPIQINARSRRGDDGCVRDYVFIGDVVRAHLAVIDGRVEDGIMNVCTGEPTSTRELAERIRALCGSHSSVCHASRRPEDRARSLLDAARFRALCQPTSLKAGLASTLAWFEAGYALRAARASLRAPSNSAYFMRSVVSE
jgi:UDP-glucose 4-epimerase